MESRQPLVSIALVTYQNAPYLVESIEGALAQTYPNIEIIIADDGSSDGSMEIISRYAEKYSRIKYVGNNVNKGVSENINLAFSHCTGEYICVIAGDDAMYPQKIEKQVAYLEANPEYEVCFHDVDVYDDNKGIVVYQWLNKYEPARGPSDALFRANWFFRKNNRKAPSGAWFGRSAYIKQAVNDKRVGIYHELLFTMGMYASKPEGKWHILNEVLGKYRVHNRSLSNDKASWQRQAEDLTTAYRLAEVKFPQYGKKIHNELAYWWFAQLLYNQVPQGTYNNYKKEFIRNFGLIRYGYLLGCKILLSKKLSGIRKIFK